MIGRYMIICMLNFLWKIRRLQGIFQLKRYPCNDKKYAWILRKNVLLSCSEKSTYDRVAAFQLLQKGGGAIEYIWSDNIIVALWNVSDSIAFLYW